MKKGGIENILLTVLEVGENEALRNALGSILRDDYNAYKAIEDGKKDQGDS